VETGAAFGGDPTLGPSVPEARNIFEASKHLAQNITSHTDMVMLGESIPGGTTTALLALRALGVDGMVSSGGPANPIDLKERILRDSFARLGIKSGDLADQPMRVVEELGDPMQASVLGFISGLAPNVELILAGGTQMIAVAALLQKMDPSRRPLIATTKYVAQDISSSFNELTASLGLQTYIAPLDFSNSAHVGLRDYERGYVKEGVGAGGSVLYAQRLGVSVEAVIERTNSLYSQFADKNS
jgi:uncharacterized protein (TIGR00303 family)